jgi:hypothetical protein
MNASTGTLIWFSLNILPPPATAQYKRKKKELVASIWSAHLLELSSPKSIGSIHMVSSLTQIIFTLPVPE